jgi:hypothetical protein
MAEATVTFSPARIHRELKRRQRDEDGPGDVASRDLERYYYALARELEAVDLSESEVRLMIEALGDVPVEPSVADLLWAEVADYAASHERGSTGVDAAALVERLRHCTYMQSLAIADALERWWNLPPDVQYAEGLRTVGLTRD